MNTFKSHRGLLVPLELSNVDTDQIIPKQFLKSIKRTGFGDNLFFDWRYQPNGAPDPKFILNKPQFKGASILVTGNNFGCGSSREHAVWAIAQYGFRVIIAPSKGSGDACSPAFADIFRNNCAKNLILTIELSEIEVEKIMDLLRQYERVEATADVAQQRLTLHDPEETTFHFSMDASVKDRLIHGMDDIALTLKHIDKISLFEKKHDNQIPS